LTLIGEIHVAILEQEQTLILKAVVGLFNGGISATNLSSLADIFEANNSNPLQVNGGIYAVANHLANSDSFKSSILAGKTTVASQVEILMNNFGLVSDGVQGSAGFEAAFFFTDQLTKGNTFGNIVADAVIYLSDANIFPAVFTDTANLLTNKALVSQLYVNENAPDVFESNVAVLAGVTQTSLLTEAQAQAIVDAFTQVTTSLTTGTDNLTGTSGSDLYSGVVDLAGSGTTISNADILNGAGGTDQLDIRIGSLTTDTTLAFVSTNIEHFLLKNQEANHDFILNFANISEETQVSSKGSIANTDTIAINVNPTAVAGMIDTLGAFDVNFSGDRSGTTDTLTLSLNGAGTTTQQATFSTVTTSGSNDNSYEIANISSTTAVSNVKLGIGAMTLKTINVSGDAKLMLFGHSDFTGLSAVDASSMTAGGLQIDASGSSETNFTFTGSAVDDRLVLKNTTIDTSGSLNGGDGDKDTIATTNINNLDKTAINKATGFEVLEGTNGSQSFSAADFTINKFLLTGTSNNASTVDDIEDSDLISFATDISGSSYGLRLEGKSAATEATIELISTGDTNGETVIKGSNNNNDVYGIEIRSNISKLTIDSTGTGSNANIIEAEKTGSDNGYAISNETTPSFKITGDYDLSIMAKVGLDISNGERFFGFTQAAKIDASEFTGNLRIAGSSSDDVIAGGTGNDIIYSQGGTDTMTGNEGADQFRLSEYNNDVNTLMDFTKGTDKIGLNQFDFANTTQTQDGATLSATDYVENRDGITNIGASEDQKVVELREGLSGSQIAADTGAAVEAYVLVFNTTTNKAELWYDNDWSTDSNRDQVITFDNIVDLAGVNTFSNTDFVEFTY
jgi:hypothetical protein